MDIFILDTKLLINILQKNIEFKESNLDKWVKGTITEQRYKKFFTWSDIVKGIWKCMTDMRQTGLKPVQGINQGAQESNSKPEGVNKDSGVLKYQQNRDHSRLNKDMDNKLSITF